MFPTSTYDSFYLFDDNTKHTLNLLRTYFLILGIIEFSLGHICEYLSKKKKKKTTQNQFNDFVG